MLQFHICPSLDDVTERIQLPNLVEYVTSLLRKQNIPMDYYF